MTESNRFGPWIAAAALVAVLWWMQFGTPSLTENDGYYHVAVAKNYLSEGMSRIVQCPPTAFGVWSQHYSDKELLFHILLMPGVALAGITGAKWTQVGLCAAIFVVFYALCKRVRIRYCAAWTAVLFCGSASFLVRIEQLRPQLLNIIITVLWFNVLISGRWFYAFSLSLFYVLSYSVPIMIPGILLIYTTVRVIRKEGVPKGLWSAVALGYLIGIFIHPHFPNNVILAKYQIWHTLINIARGNNNVINMGGEVASVPGRHMLIQCTVVLFLFLLLCASVSRRGVSGRCTVWITCFLSSAVFLLLTIWSYRCIEIFVPLATLSAGWWWSNVTVPERLSRALPERWRGALHGLVSCICVLVLAIGVFGRAQAVRAQISRAPFPGLEDIGGWLSKNVVKNEIVFTSGWAEFSELYFFCHRARYIIGLEPVFLYNYDRQKWNDWRNIIEVRNGAVESLIMKQFRSRIVVVMRQSVKLFQYCCTSPDCELAFSGERACVFIIHKSKDSLITKWKGVGLDEDINIDVLPNAFVDMPTLGFSETEGEYRAIGEFDLCKPGTVWLSFGCQPSGSVIVDGMEKCFSWGFPRALRGAIRVPLILTAGRHEVRVHVTANGDGVAGFYCQVNLSEENIDLRKGG